MQEITIKVKCNWCEEYAPEDNDELLKDWAIDLPVTFGRTRPRLVDLCPRCRENLHLALYDNGRETAMAPRTPRPKRPSETGPRIYACSCGKTYASERGLRMHCTRSGHSRGATT